MKKYSVYVCKREGEGEIQLVSEKEKMETRGRRRKRQSKARKRSVLCNEKCLCSFFCTNICTHAKRDRAQGHHVNRGIGRFVKEKRCSCLEERNKG